MKTLCLRIILSIFAPALCLSSFALAGDWETLEGVRLDKSQYADGDSFHVKHNGKDYTFRLFYVDTPETDDRYPERIRGQAKYFSLSASETIELGNEATEFVQDFLSGTFTVYTDWSDGWGASTRYRAMVYKDGKDLGAELVKRGLARASGFVPDTPWPGYKGSVWEYRDTLNELKDSAMKRGAGGFKDALRPKPAEEVDLSNPSGLLDLNAATQGELEDLPMIGPVLAGRILATRPFFTLQELEGIIGIASGTIASLRPLVIVIPPPLQPETALFYRENARYYVNSPVRIQIAELKALNDPAPDGYSVAEAETEYNGIPGGSMRLFAPTMNMKAALNRFATTDQPLEVRAWLRDYEGELILIIYRQ